MAEVAPATVEVPVIVHDVKESPELLATLRGHGDGGLAGRRRARTARPWPRPPPRGRSSSGISPARRSVPPSRAGWGTVTAWPSPPTARRWRSPTPGWDEKHTKYSGGVVLWDVTTGKETGPAPALVAARASPRSPSPPTARPSPRWRAGGRGEKNEIRSQLALWDVAGGKVRATIPLKRVRLRAGLLPGRQDPGAERDGSRERALGGQRGAAVGRGDRGRNWPRGRTRRNTRNRAACWPSPPTASSLAGPNYRGNVVLWDTAKGKRAGDLEGRGEPAAGVCQLLPGQPDAGRGRRQPAAAIPSRGWSSSGT